MFLLLSLGCLALALLLFGYRLLPPGMGIDLRFCFVCHPGNGLGHALRMLCLCLARLSPALIAIRFSTCFGLVLCW